jgi:hypothetical protein
MIAKGRGDIVGQSYGVRVGSPGEFLHHAEAEVIEKLFVEAIC